VAAQQRGRVKFYSGWLEDLKGHPGDGGFLRIYCSQACADRAGVSVRKARWTADQPSVDPSGFCSLCGGRLEEETRPEGPER
jgi:hypothetical protein